MKPSSASLGYALFLATNAASVWGGVFPFLPYENQSRELLFWFFLAQATVFAITFFANGWLSYSAPKLIRSLIAPMAAVPYFVGWCFLIASIYLPQNALPLVVVGGLCLGLGSAGFYMLWQRYFMADETDKGIQDLVLGTAFGAVIYFLLYLIPRAITVYLIPLVFMPLFALSIVLNSRRVDRNQPMFTDKPREHPHVYLQAIKVLWRSAMCMASLAFCTGIMRALAIEEPSIGSYVNVLSMAALMVSALVLLGLWQIKNLRLDILGAYRIVFPVLITSLLLLPFMPAPYVRWLAAALYALYSIALLLLMIQTGQVSRDRGVNPLFLYGFMGGLVFLLHDFGFIVGNLVEFATLGNTLNLSSIALVTVWLLALMYFMSQNRLRDALASAFDDTSIELLALSKPEVPGAEEKSVASQQGGGVVAEDSLQKESASVPAGASDAFQDRISLQVDLLRQHYGLSVREAEVAEQVVRGKTVARIAEDLYVSENTVRTHMKRIYAKLDIHKKIELVDLVESL